MKKLSLFIILALLLAGCGKDFVVLLPDLDGNVGKVIVTPRKGDAVVLSQSHQAVAVTNTEQAKPPATITDEDVQKTFAKALAAQPQRPAKFMLHFDSESTTLVAESKKLLPAIMEAVRERKSTDISIIGHTDRAGDKQYNLDLSTRRANAVAKLLMKLGLDAANMELNSHGENNPIVPTADGVPKRVNRRVEVTVR